MATKEGRKAKEERLRFETLLTDLSARFINLPANQVDSTIVDALRRVCECLDLDIAVLWQWQVNEENVFSLTHYYRRLEGPPVPETLRASESFPWSLARVQAGKSIIIPSLDAVPEGAERDVETWRHFGIQSVLTLPLSAGGGFPIGALTFNDMRKTRQWTDLMVKRLALVAEIFASAIIRKHDEQALRDSEERLTLATAAAEAGLWILDLSGKRFWINNKIVQIFGLPPGNALDFDQFMDLVFFEDRDPVRRSLEKALCSPVMTAVEYRIMLPDRQLRWMKTRGRQCAAGNGDFPRLMGVTIDITDQKHAEFESAELRRELAHITRVSMLGELAASMAHELNQPLAAILSNAQAARRFLATPNPDMNIIREILDDIVKDDKRAGEVIQRLRSLVQKKDTVAVEPVDFNEIVDEVVHLLNSELISRNVKLELELMSEIPVVMAGRVEMQQVLLNLMVNAMDAMRDQEIDQRHLEIKTLVTDGRVRLTVRDHGTGIPGHVMPDIFRPFFTTKPQGLGMGLPVSRSMVESHGGRLWVENHMEGGALFQMEFPAITEAIRDGEGGL